MQAETRYRVRTRLTWITGLTATISVMLAPSQAEANDFSDWSCKNIPFADKVCNVVEKTNQAIDFVSDPLGYIAQFFNNAVTSLFTQMMKAFLATTRIDWQDPGFIRTYGMAFAASTVLTVILWLIAVAKRAIQGVEPLQALGESIGFLLMSVLVSAFAPLAVAYTVRVFDEAAEAMFEPVAGDAADMVLTVTTGMLALMAIPGGAIIVIFFCLALLAAVAGVWLELIVRNALILSGLVFGPTVFSGLVDRDLWGHTKRWGGVMVAIIASKYVTFTVIALATGMLASDSPNKSLAQSFATVFTALALLFLALYMPFQLAKFFPAFGDELRDMYAARDDLKGRAKNVGGQVGDSYGELKSRMGGGDGGGPGEDRDREEADAADGDAMSDRGTEEAAEAGATEGAAAATGVGAAAVAAKKGVDKTKDEAEAAAERGVDGATAGLDSGSSAAAPSAGSDSNDDGGDHTPGGSAPSAGSTPDAAISDSVTAGPEPADPAAPESWPPPEPLDEQPEPPPEEMR
ncbi:MULTISPECIES: hypothetical protein [unclassified Streptomyces]|uniref:hypothetical protein n=1 Tax=unclassified Streptomyces TaxID=2593676 RepID=UPI0029AC2EDE|nr:MULTISPECIES: hypothetical protein [unclassified Streptomyces]MDX3423730.1 hypothetical protein [Streptomyces sp. ME02-6985-2c]